MRRRSPHGSSGGLLAHRRAPEIYRHTVGAGDPGYHHRQLTNGWRTGKLTERHHLAFQASKRAQVTFSYLRNSHNKSGCYHFPSE